jgi:hypothetical protein
MDTLTAGGLYHIGYDPIIEAEKKPVRNPTNTGGKQESDKNIRPYLYRYGFFYPD